MRRENWLWVGLLFVVAAWPGLAEADVAADQACGLAGAAAEQRAALPAGLLLAVGIVETGRMDVATGQLHPWPWTVNVDGAGHFFSNEAQAAAFVRLAAASGAGDIDVGCFQISLRYHPSAFASLDFGFDPAANAAFAARYLRQLKAQTGSWNGAIAEYHSAAPEIGLPYQRRVLAAWHGWGMMQAGMLPDFTAPDPVVILQAPAARLVQVITALSMVPRRGLPHVIVP